MLKIFCLLVAGVICGLCLRKVRGIGHVGDVLNAVIWIMVFLLGLEIGANQEIMTNLGTVGLEALVLALSGVAGSVFLSTLVYKRFFASERKSGTGEDSL